MRGEHIIVCDDEGALRRLVVEYLTERGFNCSEARDAATLKSLLERRTPDLVLLDVMMPGEDGLSALKRMREAAKGPPVIMLTAVADPVDKVVGLELGADDYIAKPFDLRELEARIKAVMRRVSDPPVADTGPGAGQLTFGEFALDLDAARLTKGGQNIEITAMEFALLKVFLSNRERVMSRDRLLDLAHHRDWEPFDRSIDLRISRLRRKIETDPAQPRYIKTVRGFGYVFSGE